MATATSTAPYLAQVMAQPSQPSQEGGIGARALENFLNLATIGGALWLDRELTPETRSLPDRQDASQEAGEQVTAQVASMDHGAMILMIGIAIAVGAVIFGNR